MSVPRVFSVVAIALLAAVSASSAFAIEQSPAEVPPHTVSWNGDPGAPDISGIWVRSGVESASKSPEGWLPWPPPLKATYAATWRKRVAEAAAGTRVDDPIRGCLPPGMPRFMTGVNGPMQIIQLPGRVTIYRDGDPLRRIWLDGRANPTSADLEAFSNGNAVGRYDGADLVTNVIGVKPQPIDSTGAPHSDALKIEERFHRVDPDTLRVKITLTDPGAYSRPMTSTVIYKASKDPMWEPREFICKPQTNYHPDVYVH